MIEFNGLKIDTRSLVLIAVTIVAVVALWPDGEPETDRKEAGTGGKAPAQQYSDRQNPVKQGRTAQAERPAPWQNQLKPYQPQPYGDAGGYPRSAGSPQAGAYSQQPAYGGQRYRPPYETESQAPGQRPPYGYGAQSGSPYGYNPYPGVRFRPKEQPKTNMQRRSDSGIPPAGHYSPVSPGDSAPPAYSPVQPTPWEYAPYDIAPYDVAPSGSTADLDHLYTVR